MSPGWRKLKIQLIGLRSTQRKWPQEKVDEELLTRDIIKLAREYGRYGYLRIAVLLKNTGWQVNAKRVERIW